MEENVTNQITNNHDGIDSDLPSIHILVVDHDPVSLTSITSVLEKYSYKVTTVELASVALSMIRERKEEYEIVLADFDMPEMEALAFMREIEENHMPIVMMSSDDPKLEKAVWALENGAMFFFDKPIPDFQLQNLRRHVYRFRDFMQKRGI